MAGDLGIGDGRVHRAAEAVLRFWLSETPAEKRFTRDDALDRAIAVRFAALRDEVLATHAAGWRADPHVLLAAVILLDQFSRNLFRDDRRAFAADPLARALAGEALAKGWGGVFAPEERQFLWMPFMHAETMAGQVRSLALFAALGNPINLDFARRHAAQIARFGRFPQRNAALDRTTTPGERLFLEEPGSHF